MTWLSKLFQRKPNGPANPAPAVAEAEKVRDSQFGEWDNVMHEVERVQKIARSQPGHRRPHPPAQH